MSSNDRPLTLEYAKNFFRPKSSQPNREVDNSNDPSMYDTKQNGKQN